MVSKHLVSESDIRAALKSIIDPHSGQSLDSALKKINLAVGKVTIHLRFAYPLGEFEAVLRKMLLQVFKPLWVDLELELIIDWKVNSHIPQKGIKTLPNIKNIIAVGSGKGGVGKSTTAVNLALAIQAQGAKVGILDADIYGPSLPLILGIKQKPAVIDNKRMLPIEQYGLQTMSMGYLVEDDSPMVWRGPMVSSALQQLLNETAWESLDYLIVDLPPGTGDIQLTMAQKIPVSGAVIVTTPQDIALLDARKALAMFQKLEIAVLGVVENMSMHICSACGNIDEIFGQGGGRKIAEQFAVPLLGQLPLDKMIRQQTDSGTPSVIADKHGKIAEFYKEIAWKVTARLSLQARNYSAAIPTIVE